MESPPESSRNRVPLRALLLSLVALIVPVAGAFLAADAFREQAALLWLVALIPAFLLAYYKGWRGAATALAAGMATLSLTQAVANVLGRMVPEIHLGVVIAYVGISLLIGWLAGRLHRDREKVEDLAFTDLLTGLPNRRHARFFLENEFAAARRGRTLSVVLFDLDNFKAYNDAYGHAAGDEALRAFADILRHNTRRMNLAARYGGEEFLTVMAGSDSEGGKVFAERVRQALRATQLPEGELSVSAGVAAFHPSMRSPDELLAAADHALYLAKREGRNSVRLYGRGAIPEERVGEEPQEAVLDFEGEVGEYPRAPEEMGRTSPPLTLLPHRTTGFGKGRKVLLVEGDPAVREIVADYLEREGFDVTREGDLTGAIRSLSTDFDLALTDIRLPGASGTELVSTVASRWPDTQVVVLSRVRDSEVVARALASGAHRYLTKPFGMQELRGHLVDALSRRDRIRAEAERSPTPDDPEVLTLEQRARESVVDGLRSLARTVEVRSPHFRDHGARVEAFGSAVARHAGAALDPERLSLALELHDIGVAALRGSVLRKPSALDPDELREVQKHPRTGRRLVHALLDDAEVEEVVAWHHERWDGTGYPDGLAGEAIPPSARIAAIAETLDALLSARPYREAHPWEAAVSEIEEGFGTRFDPGLREAFRSALPDLEAAHRARGNGS